jgi:WD40 repeat protein
MIWTLAGQDVVGIQTSRKNLTSIAFAPDSRTLATSGLGDDIQLWSLPSGEQTGTLAGHSTAVWSLKFILGGRYLASMGYEGTIKFWDTATWQVARTVKGRAPGMRGLVFSPDDRLAAVSSEGKVEIWSVDDWELQAELAIGTKAVNGMAFSPAGNWLAVGAADRKIRIWNLG